MLQSADHEPPPLPPRCIPPGKRGGQRPSEAHRARGHPIKGREQSTSLRTSIRAHGLRAGGEEHTELRNGRRQAVSRAWGAISKRRDAVVSSLGLVIVCMLQNPAPDGQSGKRPQPKFYIQHHLLPGVWGWPPAFLYYMFLLSPTVDAWPNLKRHSVGTESPPPPGAWSGGLACSFGTKTDRRAGIQRRSSLQALQVISDL